jgi:hypothetical protein
VLPTAAAMPNHTPRTCNNFPGEIVLRGTGGLATRTSALGGASGILGNRVVRWFRDCGHDNGGEGKYKAQVIGRDGDGLGNREASVQCSCAADSFGSGGE